MLLQLTLGQTCEEEGEAPTAACGAGCNGNAQTRGSSPPPPQALAKLLKRGGGGGEDNYDDLEGQA